MLHSTSPISTHGPKTRDISQIQKHPQISYLLRFSPPRTTTLAPFLPTWCLQTHSDPHNNRIRLSVTWRRRHIHIQILCCWFVCLFVFRARHCVYSSETILDSPGFFDNRTRQTLHVFLNKKENESEIAPPLKGALSQSFKLFLLAFNEKRKWRWKPWVV